MNLLDRATTLAICATAFRGGALPDFQLAGQTEKAGTWGPPRDMDAQNRIGTIYDISGQ